MGLGDTARLLASLELDNSKFRRGAAQAMGDLGRMESTFGRVSRTGLALGTAVGVGIERLAENGISTLFGAIQSGEAGLRELQDAQAQTQAVIESTGAKAGISAEQVRSLAEAQESLTTVDDKVIQSGENMLLTFTNIGSDVFPRATKAMVDMAVAMNGGNAEGIDLKTTAIQVGKALNDPIKGVSALRKVGVSLTDQQEKQIKTFIKQGKVSEAQAVILKELETEFGKAGEAAGKSGASGLRRFNDAIEDSQIVLAEGLAPALDDIRGELTKALSDPSTQQDIRNLGRWLGDAAKSGLEFAKQIPWGTVADGLRTAAGFAGDLIKAFTNMPPEAQAAILALAGLNKISGGAVTSIVGELGKGLIKGVLGMNAGVVNLNAGVVNGAGNAVPGGKPSGGLPGIIPTAVTVGTGLIVLDNLGHLPGALDAFGGQIDALSRNDIPAARAELQRLADSMPDFTPDKTILNSLIKKLDERLGPTAPSGLASLTVPTASSHNAYLAQQAIEKKTDAVRDAVEANRIAVQGSLKTTSREIYTATDRMKQRMEAKLDDARSAVQRVAPPIVAALGSQRLQALQTINVNVTGLRSGTTTYRTSSWLTSSSWSSFGGRPD